ncbi:hypothetical protein L218DRAFT_947327 [Marasmius fiardii PR-910]|nr:hypothetical protein L218DRAFT_947327 [Marasmius fiardii PR-910]
MTALFLLATAGDIRLSVLNGKVVNHNFDGLFPSTMRAFFCLFVISSLIADTVLFQKFSQILRAYFIWGRNLTVAVVPAILCLACTAVGFATAATSSKFLPGGSYSEFRTHAHCRTTLVVAFVTMEIALNVFVTLIIVVKIMLIKRKVRVILGKNNMSMYHSIMVMILESGIIYPITLILLPVLTTSAGDVIAYSLIQVVGIAPTLIVVRVGLGTYVQDVNSYLATMPIAEPLQDGSSRGSSHGQNSWDGKVLEGVEISKATFVSF